MPVTAGVLATAACIARGCARLATTCVPARALCIDRSPKMACWIWWNRPGSARLRVYFSVCRQIERARPGACPLRFTTRCFSRRLPGDPLVQASMKAGSNQPISPATTTSSTGRGSPVTLS
ncbi:hypothetical protein D3C71_1518190 [compost metagenome]